MEWNCDCMKKMVGCLGMFFVLYIMGMVTVSADSYTCYYEFAGSEKDIILEVDEQNKVTAKQVGNSLSAKVFTSEITYLSFLKNGNSNFTCPNNLYRAYRTSAQGHYYEVCFEKDKCPNLDDQYITIRGTLNASKSTTNISIEPELSCEYRSTNNARILFTVKNGKAHFSILGNSLYQYYPTDDFVPASSCEEQGSLWENENHYVSIIPDNNYKYELRLITDDDEKEILNGDEINNSGSSNENGGNGSHGGNQQGYQPKPGELCKDGNCDISLGGICNVPTVARTLKFLGLLFYIAKILIPAIIIIVGFVNLFQIMMSGKEDAAKKYASSIVKRVLIGVVIFLLPGMIQFVFKTADDIIHPSEASEFRNCIGCLFDPNDENECKISKN